jgi:hypothetical protein
MTAYNKQTLTMALNMLHGWKHSTSSARSANQVRKAHTLKHKLEEFMKVKGLTDAHDIKQFEFNEWHAFNYPPVEDMKAASEEEKQAMGVNEDTNLMRLF